MSLALTTATIFAAAAINSIGAEHINPFVLPWDDTSTTVVSEAGLNKPIGESWVTASPEGHLEVNGERIRFVGMNLTFEAGFPPREMAPKVAGRLAKFGVNGVRFHHVDNDWQKLLLDYSGGDSRHINTKRLDDFHYFIAQLKTNGVYVDMNLLVSRAFKPEDGFPEEISEMGWKVQHILGFFNDHALELQKEYATHLLTAVNPYTGLPMAQDPVVAFVEILNENGIIQKWMDGDLDRLALVFKKQLQTRWNEWLQDRYATMDDLRTAWEVKNIPLGENKLKNGDFSLAKQNGSTDIRPWEIEVHSGKIKTALTDGYTNGVPALKISIEEPSDVEWHVQLKQGNHQQREGELRTLSFWAKADQPVTLNVSVMKNEDPYSKAGLSAQNTLTTEWKQYSYTYLVSRDDKNIRPNFNGFATKECSVWIADVRWMLGGFLGNLPQNVSFKTSDIQIIANGEPTTMEAQHDWMEFMVGLENRYYQAMVKHLRQECGYKGLIFGTILANSPANVQAQMDVVDSHGYWQHPVFPGQAWDGKNWYVNNVPMTGKMENTFTSCALQRVKGKPFFCTEYQHPSPNSYSAEGPLLMGAYAALQDWDGYWFFDYGTGNGTGDMDRIGGFFAMSGHPTKMANLLLSANLFRRGDVQPAKEEIVMGLTPQEEVGVLLGSGAWNLASARHLGLTDRYALRERVAMSVGEKPTGVTHTEAPAKIEGNVIDSDTGELHWDVTPEHSYVQINTPRTKGLIGFTDEREFVLDDVTILPGKTELGWSTIAITLQEGTSFSGAGRALLIATGRTENRYMRWTNEKKNSVSNHWGDSPVMCECVPFSITLPVKPTKVAAFALDPLGNRMSSIPVGEQDGKAKFVMDGNAKTIWYEILFDK